MKLGWTVHYPSERPAPWMRRFAFGENSAPGGVGARAAERTKYDVVDDTPYAKGNFEFERRLQFRRKSSTD